MIMEAEDQESFDLAFEKLPGRGRILCGCPEEGEIPQELSLVMWFVDRVTGTLAFKESDDDPREFDTERYEAVWLLEFYRVEEENPR